MVADREDQKKEIEHGNSALAKCGYALWCFGDVTIIDRNWTLLYPSHTKGKTSC